MGGTMPPTPRFLVVEYDGRGLPFVDWAHARPGVTFDMILQEPRRSPAGDLEIPGIALVRGLDLTAAQHLAWLVDKHYAPWASIRKDLAHGNWLLRVTIHVANMASPAARAVAGFSARLGPPWSHVDDGIVYMRMRVPDRADAEGLAREVHDACVATGAEVQVSVESYGSHDYGVWDQLVQASIGL
jgi:hypothetical protein